MGVNELSTSTNEDNVPNTESSIKERDSNIPRNDTCRRSESKTDSTDTKVLLNTISSEIVEVGTV